MIVQLTDGVEFVVNSLKSESNKRTYRCCYKRLEEHLNSNNKEYSLAEAVDWLELVKTLYPKGSFSKYRTAVYRLDEYLKTGQLNTPRRMLPFEGAPKYACLSQESRQLLDEALAVTHYYGTGKNSFRIAVADFLFYVDSRKIASDSEISYPLLKEYLLNLKEMWSHDAYRERLNYIFSFMAFIKSGMEAELFSAYHGNSRLIFTEELEPEIQARISKIHSDIGEVTETVPNAYVRVNSTLENKVKAINSEAYTKYKARWNSFFLFLTLNELSLSEEIITIWHQIAGSQSTPLLRYVFSKENTSTKNSSPLTVFLGIPEEMGSQGFFSIKSRRQPEDSLPCWSRDLLIEYLDVERKRGKAETTIQTQRYACVKFLIFAELNGVQSCEEVTPQLLNEYS